MALCSSSPGSAAAAKRLIVGPSGQFISERINITIDPSVALDTCGALGIMSARARVTKEIGEEMSWSIAKPGDGNFTLLITYNRYLEEMLVEKLSIDRVLGSRVALEKLSVNHLEDIRAVLSNDPTVWDVMVNNGSGSSFREWWDQRMSDQETIFAIRRLSSNRIVGTTGYHSVSEKHLRVEIGSTFLDPAERNGPLNAECKLLLLDRAFDAGAARVEFLTDALNARSRASLAKIGARQEGVLRAHKITWKGRVRDTAIFSITKAEWPGARRQILERIRTKSEQYDD